MTHPPLRYAIIGTGALGGLYGACLQKAGREVHFLLHSDYEFVKQSGLTIESIWGNFTLPQVNAYRNAEEMPLCDGVVICLKTVHNTLLAEVLPHLVTSGSVVVTLQNGLSIEPEIAAILGDTLAEDDVEIVGGAAHLCSNKVGPGHIRHLDYGRVAMANYQANYAARPATEKLLAIAADFQAAGVEITLSDCLLSVRWHKLVWNIPFNGMSALLDAKTDAILANPPLRSLIEDIMQEVVTGAAACGVTIEQTFVRLMIDSTLEMVPYLTSMKLDFDRRQPMEVEAIYGNPIKMAAKFGVAMPRTEALYRQLQFINQRNCS